MAGSVANAEMIAPVVALPAPSKARRARVRNASSVSLAPMSCVPAGLDMLSIPRMGRCIAAMVRGGTTPAEPLTVARTGISTLSEPRVSVRSSLVSNTITGLSLVDNLVPLAMKISAAAGVARGKNDGAGRVGAVAPVEPEDGDELIQVAAGGGVEKARAINRFELARQHSKFAREALRKAACY